MRFITYLIFGIAKIMDYTFGASVFEKMKVLPRCIYNKDQPRDTSFRRIMRRETDADCPPVLLLIVNKQQPSIRLKISAIYRKQEA